MGYVMEKYENHRKGMIAGYSVALYAGIVLSTLFVASYCLAKMQQRRHMKDNLDGRGQSRNDAQNTVLEMR